MNKLKNNHLTLILVTGLVVFSLCCHADSLIVLPPKPGSDNDKTLLGIDKNKNKVRDDIEHFIYKEITQKPDLYLAYLKYAESLLNVVRLYPNIERIKENEKIIQSDSTCIDILDNDIHHRTRSSTRIITLIYNTPERNKIEKWYAENDSKISEDYYGPGSLDRKKVCRF